MNTIELTNNMTEDLADTYDSKSSGKRMTVHSRIPAWFKTLIYIGLGALTYQGALITYEQTKKALIQAKYAYINSVIAEDLNGKGFRLSTDMRKNNTAVFEQMNENELRMALWATTGQLRQLEGLRSDIHGLTVGIDVVYDDK